MTLAYSEKPLRRSIELFSGAGGLALATHQAGFHHEGLFEWNRDACETLASNAKRCALPGVSVWSRNLFPGDVADQRFDRFEGIDLVAGGPPCQPFSLGGKHAGMDDRRNMIPQFIRSIREARPRAFLMENVRGLARQSFATYLQYTLLQLHFPELILKPNETWTEHLSRLEKHSTSRRGAQGLEYNVVAQVLNAADYGVPQTRERLFVVGFRSDVNAAWAFPQPTHSLDRLIYDQAVSGEYWGRVGVAAREIPDAHQTRIARLSKNGKPQLTAWKTIREAIKGLPEPFEGFGDSGRVYNHRAQGGARPYPGHTGSPFDLPSKTLKAGGHGVPGGENMIDFGDGTYRYLTTREAARIQTFPDDWRFEGAWSEAMRQIGNAVPIDLAAVVAKSVAAILSRGGA